MTERDESWERDNARWGDIEPEVPFTLDALQREQVPWVLHNFGVRPAWMPLLGALEELGELAHAHLKAEQGIRHTPEEALALKRDALGDVVIFLADYATSQGIDFQAAVVESWERVRQRDWKADPRGGEARPVPPSPVWTICQQRGEHRLVGHSTGTAPQDVVWSDTCADCGAPVTARPSDG